MKKSFRLIGILVLLFFLPTGMSLSVGGQQSHLSFWTTEIEPKRMTIQNNLAKQFKKAEGIEVEVVPVKESELPTRVVAAAAANAMPDMIFLPLDYVVAWVEEGILDPKAATEVIKRLGPDSFASAPLTLAKVEGGWAAVPADGWGQLLLFRKDLFTSRSRETSLSTPNTWQKILKAAQALHDPPRIWGIAIGTDPTSVYMQQVFEQFALSNGAYLVNRDIGKVDLNTAAFMQTLEFYKRLASFTPPGNIYWRQTREDYFGGRQAMIIWSPFILDELAGLRDSVPVTVTGLTKPLHQVTGIVTAIKGPSGARPVQWGQVSYFAITRGASADAHKWVEYLLEDGYLNWLGMAPEGKFPMRPAFVDGWQHLQIGVDRKARIVDLFPQNVINSIITGVDNFDRWGFAAGKGACVGQIYGTKAVIRILRRYLDGEVTEEEAAKQMGNAIRALEGCL